MGAPTNYSHLTSANITAGRKYHVTEDEQVNIANLANGLTDTITYVTQVSGDLVKTQTLYLSGGLVGTIGAESDWQ